MIGDLKRKKVKRLKILLLSLPCCDFQFPSLQIGNLTSFARREGFDVENRHLHLEIAANFGLNDYDRLVANKFQIGELFFAAALFPEKREPILHRLHSEIARPPKFLERLIAATRKPYKSIDWKIYDTVGFSLCFDQLFASLLFAKWLKRDFPHLRILFGGPLVSGPLGESVIKCFPQVDWCIDGEGEIPFMKFLRSMSKMGADLESEVPGLIYRRSGLVHINPREQLQRLGGLPDPEFDHYFRLLNDHPKLKNRDIMTFIPIEGGRGCMHKCAFCTDRLYWKGYRIRPPEEVVDQMDRLAERYSIHRFHFVDNIVPPGKAGKQLFSLIAEKRRDYRLFCEVRANTDKDQLKIMRGAGVAEIQVGIETFSTDLLRKMNKGTRVIENFQIMKFCEELNIEQNSNFMINFPSETQTDIAESVRNIDFACAYQPPFRFVDFRLYDGSLVFKQPKQYGVTKINRAGPLSKFIPLRIVKTLSFTEKNYASKIKKRSYSGLKKRLAEWSSYYDQAVINRRKLLTFSDCGKFLRIEDMRFALDSTTPEWSAIKSITLEGFARKLYLFCDSIRSFHDIKKHFKNVPERELRSTLRKLFNLKVMYTEDDDWLSLAIHNSHGNSRHIPFS